MIQAAENNEHTVEAEAPRGNKKKTSLSKAARLTLNIISGVAIATTAQQAWTVTGMETRFWQLSQLQSPQHRDFPALNEQQRGFLETVAQAMNKAMTTYFAAENAALKQAKTPEEKAKVKDTFEAGRLTLYRNAYDQVSKALPGMHLPHNPPCTQLGLGYYPEDCVLKYFRELLAQAGLYPHIIRREQGPADYSYQHNTLSVSRLGKDSFLDTHTVIADFQSAFPKLSGIIEAMDQVELKELHALPSTPPETADSEKFNVIYANDEDPAIAYPDTLPEKEKQWAIYHTLGHKVSRKFFRSYVLAWNESNTQKDAAAPSYNQLSEAFAHIFALYTLAKKYPQEKQFFLRYLQERSIKNGDYSLGKELIFSQAHVVALQRLVASKKYFPLFSENPNVHDRASLQEYLRAQTDLLHSEVEAYSAIWGNFNTADMDQNAAMDTAITMTKKQYPASLVFAHDKGWRGWNVLSSTPLMRQFYEISDQYPTDYVDQINATLDPLKLVERHADVQHINLAGAVDEFTKILYDNIHPLEVREQADLDFIMRDGRTQVGFGDALRYVLGTK